MARNFSELSDAELLRVSASEPDAFGELYQRHASAVVAFFYSRTGCAQTALDLTAETFAEAFASRRRYRDVGAPGLAWLLAIGRHTLSHCLARRRVDDRARRRLGIQRRELDDEALERIEQLCDTADLRARVDRALSDLTPRVAEAVVMRIVLELPFAEIGKRLNCSEVAARMRVSRGLVQLHETLEVR